MEPYLTHEQVDRVLAHAAADDSVEGRRVYALIAVMLLTGRRVDEIVRLFRRRKEGA
jgi:site-specific recombinase XerD